MTDRAYPENVPFPPSLAPITALKISVVYAAAGALWILFSDRVVDGLAFDILTLTRLQTAKGWLFVAVTATLLYLLVYRAVASVERLPAGIDPAEDPDGGGFPGRSSSSVGMGPADGGTELDGCRGFPAGL